MSSESIVVLISGANVGLGLATVKSLLLDESKSYIVYMGSRSLDRANEAIKAFEADPALSAALKAASSIVIPVRLDVEDDTSIQAAHEKIAKEVGRLDVLINNAGINYDMQVSFGQLTVRQAYERAFSVNVASAHVLTEVFVDLLILSKARRIVFITTSISSLNEHSDLSIPLNHAPPAGWPKQGYFSLPTYRASKAAMNMMILEWAKTLKNDGVIVHAVNPGLLATSFGGMTKEMHAAMYAIDPMLGGRLVKSVVEGERDADIGKIISAEGTVQW